jgi:uncharacterized paraquat-inducible protein A
MRRSISNFINLIYAIGPISTLLIGGLGALYCVATNQQKSSPMLLSLILLLVGISVYTYQQAMKSEMFRRRFNVKEKSRHKHRRMGKRCPQCQQLIHHRRSVCQHCGYEFSSHKNGDDPAKSTDKETQA